MDQAEIATMEKQEKEEQSPSKIDFKFVQKHHPKNQIIGDVNAGIQNWRRITNSLSTDNLSFLSKIEPKDFTQASKDQHWVNSMEEELNQIEKSGN